MLNRRIGVAGALMSFVPYSAFIIHHSSFRISYNPPMPVLPLFDAPIEPDAWHRVTAPGGYEWWHFDAEDEAGETRGGARIYDGHAVHPRYVRAYRRYLKRPTRRTPPMAVDFPCAELAVY